MRARGVTTPLLIATASSSIDLNTVSSPGESSIRYMPDLMGAGFRAKGSAEEPDFTQLSRSGLMHFRSCRADRARSLQPLCLGWVSHRTSTTWRTTGALLLCSFLQLASAAE